MDEAAAFLRLRDDGVWLDDAKLDLTDREEAILLALANDRVISRVQLARAAQLDAQSARRSDSILVRLRRVLPDGAIRNVRARGWMLDLPIEDERSDTGLAAG